MTVNQNTRLSDKDHFKSSSKEAICDIFSNTCEKFIKRENGKIKIWAASQDWFMEEWGRDTFISLPGLLLSRGLLEEAKDVFLRVAKQEKRGLIPNRIKLDKISYNTTDASLWFIAALEKYFAIKNDRVFKKKILKTVRNIVKNYQKGTGYERFGYWQEIKMDKDGLISSPPQSTWMDADPSREGTAIITPRDGKCVEINALWYSALCFASNLEQEIGDKPLAREWQALARKVRKFFYVLFFFVGFCCLFDVLEGDPHSGALRPNQIIAVSHGKKLLTKVRKKQVFEAVTKDLLTSGGLRTLSPRDSNYKGTYSTQDPISIKDQAYHQGTVWPWLMGPYCDSLTVVALDEGQSKEEIKTAMQKVLNPLVGFCLESEFKSLPEVFSGNFPHEPGGTRSQAWSVGEVFRVLNC